MDQLLQWAITNTDPDQLHAEADAVRRGEKEPKPQQQTFDPALLEAILGKDDATRMKEAVAVTTNPNETLENREIALDNLELLVEQIDNAMNIQSMKLWPSILSLFSSSEPSLRKGAAWVCGTAVQNNLKAQQAFLDNDGLRLVLNLLRDDADREVRNKAQYAVSGTIKHFPAALAAFIEMGGYDVLSEVIARMEDPPILRKIIFLYNTLIMEDASTAQILIEKGIIKKLEEVLEKFRDDEDMVEKVIRTLHTLFAHTSTPVPTSLVATLRDLKAQHNELGLAEEEWRELGV